MALVRLPHLLTSWPWRERRRDSGGDPSDRGRESRSGRARAWTERGMSRFDSRYLRGVRTNEAAEIAMDVVRPSDLPSEEC